MFRRICQCKNVNRDDRLKSLRVIMILSMWSEVNFVSSKEFLERFYINNNTVQFISNVTRNLGKKTGSVSKPSLARLALQRRTGLRIEKKRAGGRAGEEERRRKAIVASVRSPYGRCSGCSRVEAQPKIHLPFITPIPHISFRPKFSTFPPFSSENASMLNYGNFVITITSNPL